jgi:putative PIN family toxin of toxin-antitoxin system
MTVVVDTNVLYQALKSNLGASYFILQLVRQRKLRLAISVPVFIEYEDVLNRKKSLQDFKLSKVDIEIILRFLAYIGIPYNIFYVFRPNLRDEGDNIFIELALASNAKFLITRNVDDFLKRNELKFNDLKIITPSEFVKIWRGKYENKS